MPAARRSAAIAPATAGQLDVVDDAERPVPWIRAPVARLEARHVAALLVDGDDELAAFGAQRAPSTPQLAGSRTFHA